jgi:hypothetical protein
MSYPVRALLEETLARYCSFTPQTVHHYHRALTEQGIELPLADFMERYMG